MRRGSWTTGLIWLVSLAIFGIVDLAEIIEAPGNVTALIGSNASFSCVVRGQQNFDESLLWTKLSTESSTALGPTLLSLNQLTRDVDKYLVSDKYVITVVNVTRNDSGAYLCSMNDMSHLAYLTAAVVPDLDLSWKTNRTTVTPGETVSLTCTATGSSPPASIRWFKAGRDITLNSVITEIDQREDGLADTTSVQEVTIAEKDEGAPYRCVADINEIQNVISAELLVQFDAGSTLKCAYYVTVTSVLLGLFAERF